MEKDKESAAAAKRLKARAKDLLKETPSSIHEAFPPDLHALIENLRTHQIELEMQNEELRNAQASLEISEQKYFDLYDLAPVGYVTISPGGAICEINLTAADLLGFARSQLISKNFGRFVFPDYQDIFYLHCRTVLKTLQKNSCELKLVKEDGTHLFVQMDTLPIRTNGGDVSELRAAMTDISERKLLQDSLLEGSKTIQALNDAISESAILLDRAGTVLMINETAARRLGQNVEAMIGLNIHDVLPPEVSKSRRNYFAEVQSTGRALDFQDIRSGRRYWHSLQPILGAKGEVEKIAVFARDVTLDHEALEALVESEKKYRQLVNAAPIGIVVTQNRFLQLVNSRVLAISGYSEPELTSRSFVEIIHPDDRDMVATYHERRLNGAQVPDTYLMRMITRCGEIKWIENKGVLIEWKGRPATLNFLIDVTDRQQAAEKLLKSETQKQTILDAATDQIHYVDSEMKVIWVNKAVLQELKVTMENVIGQFCYHIFQHRDRVCDDCPSLKARKTHQIESAVLRMGKKPDVTFRDVFSSPLKDEHGNISGSIQIVRDVTSQRKAEKALRRSEATLNMLLESIPIPVFYKDRNGRYLGCNKAFETFLGKSKKELIGKSVFDINPAEIAKAYHAKDIELFENPGSQVYESQVQGASGVLYNVIFHKAALVNAQGIVTGLVGVILDITERKLAEEKIHKLSQLLIQAQENERQLIACELHDGIAQNLSVLKINCDSMRSDPSLPALQEKLAASSGLLYETIMSVRNLAYGLRLPGLHEMGLVKALENYCAEAAENGKIKVDFQSAGMSVIELEVNMEIHIYRLIQEGLSNILKHAEADRAIILLLGSSPNILLRIEDNGRGFDVKEQEILSASTKRMGIRSMQERVNLLQGQMTIQSQPLEGTKILIKIPLPKKPS